MRSCATCGASIEGRNARARFCSDLCRARGRRLGHAVPAHDPAEVAPAAVSGRVTAATRAEVDAVGLAGAALAEVALTLALQIDALADPRTMPGLTREWRAAMAELRAMSTAAPVVNPLDELRRRREQRSG